MEQRSVKKSVSLAPTNDVRLYNPESPTNMFMDSRESPPMKLFDDDATLLMLGYDDETLLMPGSYYDPTVPMGDYEEDTVLMSVYDQDTLPMEGFDDLFRDTLKLSPLEAAPPSRPPLKKDPRPKPSPPAVKYAANGDVLAPLKRLSSMSPDNLIDLMQFYIGTEEFKAVRKADPALLDLQRRIFNENNQIDLKFLEGYGFCRISPDIFPRGVNPQKLGETMSQRFNDAVVMQTAHCILDTAFEGGLNNNTITSWMQQMIVLATTSVEGVVFASTMQSPVVRLVAKYPRGNFDLTHEAAVGVVTNQLRKYMPSFAYYLTSFTCGPPLTSGPLQKGMVVQPHEWCSAKPDGQRRYVVYENIPGQTFKSFIEDNGPQIGVSLMYNLVLQILTSLMYAKKACGFTHYDLHTENIIIRSLGGLHNVVYQSPPEGLSGVYSNEFVTFSTSYIPTIIDYGFARVAVMADGKETILSPGGSYTYIRDTVAAPVFVAGDVYRMLMNTYLAARRYSCPTETLEFLEYALSGFFAADYDISADLDIQVTKINPLVYHSLHYLPINEDTKAFTVENYIEYLREKYFIDFAYTNAYFKNIPRLQCCLTNAQVYRRMSN